MNSNVKTKKKRLKKIHQSIITEPLENQQQLASESLCFISNFQDHLTENQSLNPQAQIFNSVHFHQNLTTNQANTINNQQDIKFHRSPSKSAKVLELQKYMDNKFIQQSRMLLKLYQNHHQNQHFSQTPNKINFKQSPKTTIGDKRSDKTNLINNTFKSDCVFVVKRMPVKQNYGKKQKIMIKSENLNIENNNVFLNLKAVPVQKGNNMLRIAPIIKKTETYNNWMTRSLELSTYVCSNQRQKRNKYPIMSQYKKIQNFRSLNSTLNYNNPNHRRQSHKIINHKHYSSDQNKKEEILEDRNNNSFRKRFTFYQTEKNKSCQKKYNNSLK